MADTPQQTQKTPQQPEQQKAAPQQPATGGDETRRATPAVFGDGSTKEQQDAQVQAANETNKLIKEAGDAERDARTS